MARRQRAGLSRRDQAIIDLEREWGQAHQVQDYKFEAAQRDLGLTPGGYALILSGIIDDPYALEYDRETILRLRQVRQLRRTSEA